jgi:ketosteroid isomerase-like protein
MKRVIFLLMAAAAAVGSCAPLQAVQSQPADEASLRAANADYDRAILAADAAALGRIYAEDFSFVGDKGELRNKPEQIRYMTNGSLRVLAARSDDIAVTRLGADHALLTGRFSGRFRAGATEADFVERYSSVWERDGTRWRLRHEHSSLLPQPQNR